MDHRPVRARVLTLVLGTMMLVVATATPAFAHGRGSDATNYVSRIVAVPELPGVTWRIYNNDEFLGVENTSDTDLVVPSYDSSDERPVPYLRIGPEGVFANRNSSAYFLNQTRYITVQPPPGVGQGQPDWVMISGQHRYAWHDHRIHWMAPKPPAQVRGATTQVKVNSWAVPFIYGGQSHVVEGVLLWSPGQPAWLWLLGALAVVSLPVLTGLRTRPSDGAWPGLLRPAAATLAVVSAVNLFHLVDDLSATPVPLTLSAVAGLQTTLFIAIGLFGAYRAWQAGDGAFTALAVGAGSIFIGQGLLYFSSLSAPYLATVFPVWLTRGIVALSVAQALPLGFVVFYGTSRTSPAVTPGMPRATTRT
jgi:hypothetical protein